MEIQWLNLINFSLRSVLFPRVVQRTFVWYEINLNQSYTHTDVSDNAVFLLSKARVTLN